MYSESIPSLQATSGTLGPSRARASFPTAMQEATLLQKFVDSELIRGLSSGDKAVASFYVTIMGMAITFVALGILWGCINLMAAVFKTGKKKKAPRTPRPFPPGTPADAPSGSGESDGELIAVITAAVAAARGSALPTIRVKPISTTEDPTPQWGKVGRMEQLLR